MSLSNNNIDGNLTKILKDFFSLYPEIERAILYGSRAKGNNKKNSDIDISIVAPQMDFSTFLKVYYYIEELNIPYIIDLTKYELLDKNIKEHINRVGIEIYKKT